MKPQATLRFASFFAVNLAVSLHAASVIQFTAASFTVAENAGQATLTVQRTEGPDTPVSVDYATADGTATNGLKYTAISGTLAFGTSETNKSIVVPILNEGFVEGTKSFRVILSNPSGGAVLGTRTNILVSITDNDSPLKVEFASYEAREDEATVVIGVLRGPHYHRETLGGTQRRVPVVRHLDLDRIGAWTLQAIWRPQNKPEAVMEAPAGGEAKLKVNVFAGRSASVAWAWNLSVLSSSRT